MTGTTDQPASPPQGADRGLLEEMDARREHAAGALKTISRLGEPVPPESAALRAEVLANVAQDWTIDPSTGKSNSSDQFAIMCAAVGRILRAEFRVIDQGAIASAARLVMAQLAHVHGLTPVGAFPVWLESESERLIIDGGTNEGWGDGMATDDADSAQGEPLQMISARFDPALVTALGEYAARHGQTLSDALRDAARLILDVELASADAAAVADDDLSVPAAPPHLARVEVKGFRDLGVVSLSETTLAGEPMLVATDRDGLVMEFPASSVHFISRLPEGSPWPHEVGGRQALTSGHGRVIDEDYWGEMDDEGEAEGPF